VIAVIGGTLAAILSTCALIGLAVKFILMPYIRENVIKPIHETHRQMTVNSHASSPPTFLDLMDDKFVALERAVNGRLENMNNTLLMHIVTGHGNAQGYSDSQES